MGSAVDRMLTEQLQGTGNINLGQPQNKVDSILTSPVNKVDAILQSGGVPFDPERLMPRPVTIPEEIEDPGLLSQLLDILKEQGKSLVQFGKYAVTSGYSPAAPITAATSGRLGEDIRAAAAGDQEALLRVKRGTEGAALVGSTIVGSGAAAMLRPAGGAAAPFLKRAAAFLGAEALGGATYGAVRPLEADEDREEAIKEDMIAFPIAGAAMHGIFKGVKFLFKGFRGISPEAGEILRTMNKEEASTAAARVKQLVDDAAPDTPQAERLVHAEALEQAAKETRAKRQTTVTAKMAQEAAPDEPDFTVEINKPPSTSVVTRRSLEPISEQQFQQELADITPRPSALIDEEAAARARVEAARTTPFPSIGQQMQRDVAAESVASGKVSRVELLPDKVDNRYQVRVWTPLTSTTRNLPENFSLEEARQYAKDAHTKLTNDYPGVTVVSSGFDPDIPSGITDPLPGSVVRTSDGTLQRVYHGTTMVFDRFDDDLVNPESLYGPGHYFTDNPVVAGGSEEAKGYVAKIPAEIRNRVAKLKRDKEMFEKTLTQATGDLAARTRQYLDETNNELNELEGSIAPNVRPAFLDIRRPFNIDKTFSKEEYDALGLEAIIDDAMILNPGEKVTGQEIYDSILDAVGDKNSVTEVLMEAGFDGITHIGGKRTAAGAKLAPEGHKVYIAFRADQIHTPWDIELQRLMRQAARQPDSPAAQAAVADAVADAVVAETKATELMPPSMAAEAAQQATFNPDPNLAEMVSDVAMKTTQINDYIGAIAEAGRQGMIDAKLEQVAVEAGRMARDEKISLSQAFMKLAAEKMKAQSQAGGSGLKYAAELYSRQADEYLDMAKLAAGFGEQGTHPIQTIWSEFREDPREAKFKWSNLNQDQMAALRSLIERFFRSDAGAISARAATRIASTALSGLSFYAAEQQDDPQAEALLNTVGGILAMGSLMPGSATKKWLRENDLSYRIIKAFSIDRIATDGTKKGMQEWQAVRSQGVAFAKNLERTLREVFPDDVSSRAAMYSLDEGPAAPEFATLTAAQQKEVISQAILNSRIGAILTGLGIIKSPRANYVRHLFQDRQTGQMWYGQWESLMKSGAFAKARSFETLREAEKWAAAVGRPGPVMDVAKVQSYHTIEVTKAIANVRIQKAYERLGLLQDFDGAAVLASSHLPPRDRLRQVRITNLGGAKMAPDDAATVLERAADGASKFGLDHEYWQALDAAKAQMMRGIMFWAWEHGINVWRGAMAIDGTGVAYLDALKRVKAADPVIMEASKYTNLYHRPDFGPEGQTLFDKAMAKLGAKAPTLAKIGTNFEHWREKGERQLWDEWVPALGLAAWSKEMHRWTQRTGGRHLPGSPEYEAAAQQAGRFASAAMGKIPELIQSPTVSFIMRQMLFSPQWTRGRISIMAHAYGEVQKIASGEINPREARYLAYKLRSMLLAGALTAIGSYALTQEWPEFNPNTLKFYVKTGVKDHNGREMGVDLTGWWQDDLKVFNDPWAFVRDRQNPVLRAAGAQVNGRDVFGRPITGMERLENLIGAFGPPGELVVGGANAVAQGHLSGAEALKMGSGLAAVGNVATLPREADAIVAKMAAKILRQSGLPDDKDRVYELSRLMRQNWYQQGTLIGGEIPTWIAYQRRAYQRRGIPWLWQETKQVLGDLAR